MKKNKKISQAIIQYRKQSALLSGTYPYQLKPLVKKPKSFYNNLRIKQFIILGIYYGYPDCCIYEFIKRKPNRLNVSQCGFVLCHYHGREATQGRIKPEDLIYQRICKHKFPKEDDLFNGSKAEITFSREQMRVYRKLKRMLSKK